VAQITTAGQDVVYEVATLTTDKQMEFQVDLSNAETAAIAWSIADTDCIVNQLEKGIMVWYSK